MAETVQGLANSRGVITIFRGECTESIPIKKAASWTIDKEVAEFFRRRYLFLTPGETKIYTAEVNPCNVIAYTNERKEKELIILPGSARILSCESFPASQDGPQGP